MVKTPMLEYKQKEAEKGSNELNGISLFSLFQIFNKTQNLPQLL